ncbi:MAG: 4Fe-4S binding protein [Bacteroidales bacterium]|nr:4Fe-4S binding protein [Bacteroidales bacterium]MCM1147927.1 4Fe-4S binding protein [Bacteroidales bacterium]MCM1205476.1 4Fe-4S binding protein [Bacillota bacterium]MCM1509262.1 4Fe-4S binding protein [Clostridium sp.]
MTVHQIIFSPTGGTERVSRHICEGIGKTTVITDLCVQEKCLLFPVVREEDIAIVAMPVFAGRVPSLAVRRFRNIAGNNARCVVVAVYGNRAYDDALLEMYDVASSMGFRVIAAISAVAEHSIVRMYGTGRPDRKDSDELFGFGKSILERMENAGALSPQHIPGNRPYRVANAGPFPMADEGCTACGKCVANCPVDAIPEHDFRNVRKDICISCMRCVSICPTGSRGVGEIKNLLEERLGPLCATRKDNELIMQCK